MAGKLAVFDFDGTLFFTDGPLLKAGSQVTGRSITKEEIKALPRELKSKVYEIACSNVEESTPNRQLIARLNSMAKRGCRIVILTARHKSSEPATLRLVQRDGVHYDEMYHDPALVHVPDEEFKAQKLKELIRNYDLVEVYEDKRDNIEYLKERLGLEGFDYYLVEGAGFRKV